MHAYVQASAQTFAQAYLQACLLVCSFVCLVHGAPVVRGGRCLTRHVCRHACMHACRYVYWHECLCMCTCINAGTCARLHMGIRVVGCIALGICTCAGMHACMLRGRGYRSVPRRPYGHARRHMCGPPHGCAYPTTPKLIAACAFVFCAFCSWLRAQGTLLGRF